MIVAVVGPLLGLTGALPRASAPGFTHLLFALLGLGAFVAGGPSTSSRASEPPIVEKTS